METRLRTLAAKGLSYGAIGKDMGLSRNAVIAKAHRLNLPARASPIVKSDAPKRIGGFPKVGRPSQRRDLAGEAPSTLEQLGAALPRALPVVVDMPPPVTKLAPVRAFSGRECCWPIGEPRTKAFRYCDGLAVAGKSYCAEHCALAYVQRPERSEAQREADELRRLSVLRRLAPGGVARGDRV
jgi:GcrA cell cycle regulator